jgi:hypothetical protein
MIIDYKLPKSTQMNNSTKLLSPTLNLMPTIFIISTQTLAIKYVGHEIQVVDVYMLVLNPYEIIVSHLGWTSCCHVQGFFEAI